MPTYIHAFIVTQKWEPLGRLFFYPAQVPDRGQRCAGAFGITLEPMAHLGKEVVFMEMERGSNLEPREHQKRTLYERGSIPSTSPTWSEPLDVHFSVQRNFSLSCLIDTR